MMARADLQADAGDDQQAGGDISMAVRILLSGTWNSYSMGCMHNEFLSYEVAKQISSQR